MAVIISSNSAASVNATFWLTTTVNICDSANSNNTNGCYDVYLPALSLLITDCAFTFNTEAKQILVFAPGSILAPLLPFNAQLVQGYSAHAFKPMRYVYIGSSWCLFEQGTV